MLYKTIPPKGLRPGDRVRRLGKLWTVSCVTAASDNGVYDVEFDDGLTVRLAGAVTVVDQEWTRAVLRLDE
jgi:hypothetical protein